MAVWYLLPPLVFGKSIHLTSFCYDLRTVKQQVVSPSGLTNENGTYDNKTHYNYF